MPSSPRTTWISLVSSYAKVFRPTNKLQKEIFRGNSFPNCTILCMNMYTSSKVTHAKYAVAETRIPSVKRITVIPVLRNLWPLLTMYFCVEFQDRKLMLIHVWCQKQMKTSDRPSLMMSTLLVTTSASWLPSLTRKLYLNVRVQLYRWHKV